MAKSVGQSRDEHTDLGSVQQDGMKITVYCQTMPNKLFFVFVLLRRALLNHIAACINTTTKTQLNQITSYINSTSTQTQYHTLACLCTFLATACSPNSHLPQVENHQVVVFLINEHLAQSAPLCYYLGGLRFSNDLGCILEDH